MSFGALDSGVRAVLMSGIRLTEPRFKKEHLGSAARQRYGKGEADWTSTNNTDIRSTSRETP